MDKIRVIKLLIYEGNRNVVEHHLKNTIDGKRTQEMHARDENNIPIRGSYSITGIYITRFPEILEKIDEETKNDLLDTIDQSLV